MVLLAAATSSAGMPEPAVREILVTTLSDDQNGPISALAALLSQPGLDGISLREAIEVTNNDPGAYTIAFAPALRGGTIAPTRFLPPLTGGGVTIDGSGVTIRLTSAHTVPPVEQSVGLWVASSGNRLHGFAVEGFTTGVLVGPYWDPWGPLGSKRGPAGVTLADNVIDGLAIRGRSGISVQTGWSWSCGPRESCWTYTTWKDLTITGNTIEAAADTPQGARADEVGIAFKIDGAGERVEGVTVTGNAVRVASGDTGIAVVIGDDAVRSRISEVLIARNTVEGSASTGINVASGGQRAREGTVERVQVLDNRIDLDDSLVGVAIQAGTDKLYFATMADPPRYPDDNLIRDVLVRGNTIGGDLEAGIHVNVAWGGAARGNTVTGVRIEGNSIETSRATIGVFLSPANSETSERCASGNQISSVAIVRNAITTGSIGEPQAAGDGAGAAGVVINAGRQNGCGNAIRDVDVQENEIATAYTGVRIIGGLGPSATGNSVTCVRLSDNVITGAEKDVSVVPNANGATGNVARLTGCAGEPPPTPEAAVAPPTSAGVAGGTAATRADDGGAAVLVGAALGAVALGALAVLTRRRRRST